jgi:hypothetical protein
MSTAARVFVDPMETVICLYDGRIGNRQSRPRMPYSQFIADKGINNRDGFCLTAEPGSGITGNRYRASAAGRGNWCGTEIVRWKNETDF